MDTKYPRIAYTLFLYCFSVSKTDLFSRRFRGRIFFPNFVERSILKLPLSKLCAVPFALQNRASRGRKGRKDAEKRGGTGRERGGQQKGQKGKQDMRKTGQKRSIFGHCFWITDFCERQTLFYGLLKKVHFCNIGWQQWAEQAHTTLTCAQKITWNSEPNCQLRPEPKPSKPPKLVQN